MTGNKSVFFISIILVFVLLLVICFFSVRFVKREESAMRLKNEGELCNKIEISVSEAKDFSITYTSDNIKVYPAEGNAVIIKEYLRPERGEEALASVNISEGKATVTGGKRMPLSLLPGISIGERIEVYLPGDGLENLELQVSSGNISAEEELGLQVLSVSVQTKSGNIKWQDTKALQVKMEASSGNLRVSKVAADTLVLMTKSGNISGEELSGEAELLAGSGNVKVTELSGSGNISTRSGGIDVEVKEMCGDMTFEAGSGNVKLVVHRELSFLAEMNTRSGNIHTDFDDSMKYNKDGNHAEGRIGENPVGKLSLTAGSGNVRLVTE